MTPRQNELAQQLYGDQPQHSMGAIEAVKEAFRTVAPGLTWDKISKDLGNELTHQVGASAHELAAALFNGNAFVMYQRDGKEDQPAQEQAQDDQAIQHDVHGQHLERGGRSM